MHPSPTTLSPSPCCLLSSSLHPVSQSTLSLNPRCLPIHSVSPSNLPFLPGLPWPALASLRYCAALYCNSYCNSYCNCNCTSRRCLPECDEDGRAGGGGTKGGAGNGVVTGQNGGAKEEPTAPGRVHWLLAEDYRQRQLDGGCHALVAAIAVELSQWIQARYGGAEL